MYSKLILFLVQCICSSFSRAEPTKERLLDQIPEQYIFAAQNHQMQDETLPPDKNPYFLYYPTNNYFLQTRTSHANQYIPKIRSNPRRIKPTHQVAIKKPTSGFLSRYMEPPAADATSSYAKFWDHPTSEDDQREINFLPYNHKPDVNMKYIKNSKNIREQRPKYNRDHDPFYQSETDSEPASESKLNSEKKNSKKKPLESLKLSPDGDRVEFQIQGHEGPQTYIFGFDTGDGKNRQFRLEEKLRDGSVKGHYGYYDARGKLRTIRYSAGPFQGYMEKHHVGNNVSSEEE